MILKRTIKCSFLFDIKFKYLIILFCLFLLGKSVSCYSQQNFFNVPSSEITPKKKIFIQQQINAYQSGYQSSTTFDLGLGKGFELGCNYVGLGVENRNGLSIIKNDSISPFLLLNGQKRIDLTNYFALAIGGQFGASTTKILKSGGLAFLNLVFEPKNSRFKNVIGLYYASDSYFGNGERLSKNSPLGIQFGFEEFLIENKFSFQIDFISGHHSVGESVLGCAYYMSKSVILSLGYQQPNCGSASVRSLVFELTYNPR